MQNKCLICFGVIDEKFLAAERKKRKDLRLDVHKVAKSTFKNSLLQKCAERKDKWGDEVKERIDSVRDLKAAGTIYHRTCYELFMNVKFKAEGDVGKAGRRPNLEIDKTMKEIYSTLNNSDECNFDLEDLLKEVKGYVRVLM